MVVCVYSTAECLHHLQHGDHVPIFLDGCWTRLGARRRCWQTERKCPRLHFVIQGRRLGNTNKTPRGTKYSHVFLNSCLPRRSLRRLRKTTRTPSEGRTDALAFGHTGQGGTSASAVGLRVKFNRKYEHLCRGFVLLWKCVQQTHDTRTHTHTHTGGVACCQQYELFNEPPSFVDSSLRTLLCW